VLRCAASAFRCRLRPVGAFIVAARSGSGPVTFTSNPLSDSALQDRFCPPRRVGTAERGNPRRVAKTRTPVVTARGTTGLKAEGWCHWRHPRTHLIGRLTRDKCAFPENNVWVRPTMKGRGEAPLVLRQ
jgi:hypothetical protein